MAKPCGCGKSGHEDPNTAKIREARLAAREADRQAIQQVAADKK